MPRLSNRSRFEQLLDTWEPKLAAAFMAAVDDIRSTVTLRLLVERLEKGDVQGALDVLRIERAAFAAFVDAIVSAYHAGGVAATEVVPLPARARFDYHDPQVAAEIAAEADSTVAAIVSDMTDGLGEFIAVSLAAGTAARKLARMIVGYRNRVTGILEGGLIGLSRQQMQYATAAATELSSPNAEMVDNYLLRKQRERRLDPMVKAAKRAKRGIPSAEVSRLLTKYRQNMFRLRADVFGRAKSLTAINMGISTAIRQTMQREGLSPDRLMKTWHSRRDDRVRHTHRGLESKEVVFDGVFLSPSGALLRFPGDPRAPRHETINCRCYLSFSVAGA